MLSPAYRCSILHVQVIIRIILFSRWNNETFLMKERRNQTGKMRRCIEDRKTTNVWLLFVYKWELGKNNFQTGFDADK